MEGADSEAKNAYSKGIPLPEYPPHAVRSCGWKLAPGAQRNDIETVAPVRVGDTLGYARVSTHDQNPDAQRDRLIEAGAIRVFTDIVPGKRFDRPALAELIDHARPGDRLCIIRLDRLGRSLRQLLETVDDLPSPLPHDIETELGIGVTLLGSEPEPLHGFGIVFRHAIASGVDVPEVVLGIDIPLLGSASIPFHGFGLVFRHTRAGFVHDTEAVLGLSVSLPGRLAPPLDGLFTVSGHDLAVIVHVTQAVLGKGIPLCASEPVPLHGFSLVFRHAITCGVYATEDESGIGVSLLGSEPVPTHGFSFVFRHAITQGVHATEVVLGIGVSLLGSEQEPLHGFSIVRGDALAIDVHATEAVLGLSVSCLAASRHHLTASLQSWGTPAPASHMSPRLYCASASPVRPGGGFP